MLTLLSWESVIESQMGLELELGLTPWSLARIFFLTIHTNGTCHYYANVLTPSMWSISEEIELVMMHMTRWYGSVLRRDNTLWNLDTCCPLPLSWWSLDLLSHMEWACLCKLRIHDRLKLLLYNTVWNIQPTLDRIGRATLSTTVAEPIYPLYNSGPDNIQHLFLECCIS